jgi:heat shock transcription factor
MGERLQATEQRQQQIMAFLAKAVQTPGFLAHLVAQNENNKWMAASARKKRRLAKGEIEGEVEDSFDPAAPTDGQIIALQTNGEVVNRIMQLLSLSDASYPTINEGYLYPLISDHDSAPVSSEGNTLNRQSGITFMDPSTGLAEHVHSDPVVTDPKKNEDIVQLHPTSPTSDVARAAGIRSYAWFPVPNAFKGSLNTILESPILTHSIICLLLP